jgi:hypothetical protein
MVKSWAKDISRKVPIDRCDGYTFRGNNGVRQKAQGTPWWKSRRIGAEIMPDRRAREANRDRLDKQAE